MLLSLDVKGRRVVVVGAGTVGTRRARALAEAGANVVVVSPFASADIEALASRAELEWAQRTVQRADVEGAWLVTAATGDPGVTAGGTGLAVAAMASHAPSTSARCTVRCAHSSSARD